MGYYDGGSSTSYGSKYDRELDTAEIAKRVRKAYREAVKAGELPAAKVSITTDRFAGGSSITAKIKEMPNGVECLTPEWLAWREEHPHEAPPYYLERWTNELRVVAEWLEGALSAYNFDGSDPMVDYFHVNFYSSIVAPDGCSIGCVKSDETKAAEEQHFDEEHVFEAC